MSWQGNSARYSGELRRRPLTGAGRRTENAERLVHSLLVVLI